MFLNFKIINYRSIGAEVIVNFKTKNTNINNLACLIGPNASGKSNILKGIVNFLTFICDSYSSPFLRDNNVFTSHFCYKNCPIKFSTEFIDNKKQYKYEIAILKGKIQKETLEEKNKKTKRYISVFNREIEKQLSNTKTINKQDIERLSDDMSLMSLMLQLNYFNKNEFLLLRNFITNIQHNNNIIQNIPMPLWIDRISKKLQQDNLLFDELINELNNIDTGISSLILTKIKLKDLEITSFNEVFYPQELATILANHKIDDKEYQLPITEESNGTLNYISIFVALSNALKNGGIVIIDELERSLHPDITNRIIEIFLNKEKNPNNAQLLFSTHNHLFLQDLTKMQIFIIEKNDKAETEITRLDEIKGIRKDENYFIKYNIGEYEGHPKIKDF